MDKTLIIIPVLNLWSDYTIHCLESIAASLNEQFHLVLIDNGSSDDTEAHAPDFAGRKLPGRMTVIRNAENRGCAGGWNQGVAWGMERGFTYFAILNNDILISPRTIEGLYERAKVGDKMLVSALNVMYELQVPQQVLDINSPANNKDASEASHPNFSCFMITRECVEKVGYFDETFFPAYFEDNDYHYRIKLAAGPDAAIATTAAAFVHYGSRTQNQVAGGIVRGDMFQKNEQYFVQKWGGVPGQEKWAVPFNDSSKDLTYAKRTV